MRRSVFRNLPASITNLLQQHAVNCLTTLDSVAAMTKHSYRLPDYPRLHILTHVTYTYFFGAVSRLLSFPKAASSSVLKRKDLKLTCRFKRAFRSKNKALSHTG